MEQEKKTTSGAPSSDTTSALFVSARKKQLEQQEEERRAKAKEEERLAAEAEVRRLEAEVEERRRKAGEEARRVAEEARAKIAQAAENPDAILGAAPQLALKDDGSAKEADTSQSAAPAKAKGGKKTFLLGAAAGVVALIVLFIVWALVASSDDPDSSFEIYGSYYLDGDASQGELYLDSSGDFSMSLLDETFSGEWSASGDQLSLTANDETETMQILDNDTLDFGERGTFLRVDGGADPGDKEWYPDKDADFDSTVAVTAMALGVAYPSSQFSIEEQTADGFTLKSQDGQAYINYNKMRQGSTWTHEEMSAVKDALLTAMVDSLPDAVITDNVYDESKSKGYFALNYELDGVTRYEYVVVQGWNNLTDGSKWYYAGLVDCPDSQSDVYSALFNRVHESRFDT